MNVSLKNSSAKEVEECLLPQTLTDMMQRASTGIYKNWETELLTFFY